MQNIHTFIDKVSDHIGKTISLLILPLIIIIVYSVIMRYVFKDALIWSFEVSLFIFGSYGMLGGAYCVLTDSHVNVDILPRKLSQKGQLILKIISSLIILTVTTIMLTGGIASAYESTLILERSIHQTSFNPQIWWFRWVIPLAALLVIIQVLSNLILTIKEIIKLRINK